MRRRLALIVLMFAPAVSGCSSTTSPTVLRRTETFSGTVAMNGFAFHTFNVSNAGLVEVTLTAAGPPPTVAMGIGIGVPTGSTCASLRNGSTAITPAGTTPQLTGQTTPGPLCVEVYDVGNQTDTILYAVTVVHP